MKTYKNVSEWLDSIWMFQRDGRQYMAVMENGKPVLVKGLVWRHGKSYWRKFNPGKHYGLYVWADYTYDREYRRRHIED